MTPSFCVVLPIRNIEATLDSVVVNVLDAADQTGAGFEVLIVDNGSQDETWDTACELARRFPQISAIRSPIQRGLGQIIDLARGQTQANWMCVHRGVGPVGVDEIVWLWQSHSSGATHRLEHSRPGKTFGFQLLPRPVQTPGASTAKLASRIALIERARRKGTARQHQRQLLFGAAVSDLNLAK